LPPGSRGAGAFRSTSPELVRGAFNGGTFIHWQNAGNASSPSPKGNIPPMNFLMMSHHPASGKYTSVISVERSPGWLAA
jgi:hypothetical protein